MPNEEREKIIFQRAQKLVKMAFDQTDFYHKKYLDAGLTDGIIHSMEEFSKLPTLEKNDLRNCFNEIVNHSISTKYQKISTTGGSTGVPTRVLHDTRVPTHAFEW